MLGVTYCHPIQRPGPTGGTLTTPFDIPLRGSGFTYSLLFNVARFPADDYNGVDDYGGQKPPMLSYITIGKRQPRPIRIIQSFPSIFSSGNAGGSALRVTVLCHLPTPISISEPAKSVKPHSNISKNHLSAQPSIADPREQTPE